MEFSKFNFTSLESLKGYIRDRGLDLEVSENTDILKKSHVIGGLVLPNSIVFHPMEGTDSNFDGSPHELTIRRYTRFSRGMPGLIWFEATAVTEDGRVGKRQLWINDKNADSFKRLRETIGENTDAPVIMQLTHSGRFSKPQGVPKPVIGYHNPYLNERMEIESHYPTVSDDYLKFLEEKFEKAAGLAQDAGFDGVDIKGCHRYLNSELFSAFLRSGLYGGSFENRTRFMVNIYDRIKASTKGSFTVTTRMNIYDGIPYPYGWGQNSEKPEEMDLSEPIKLISLLKDRGMAIINLTMGSPYYNPHVNRPYDKGPYIPSEHPLEGIERLVAGMGKIQRRFPDLYVVGTGYSWLREYGINLGAGTIERGFARLIGFGRQLFAYPEFARDVFEGEGFIKRKSCIACTKCSDIMKNGGPAGCVIRDGKVYVPIYREYVMGGKNR